MSFEAEGHQVPIKTLKRGAVIGYDSILTPSVYEITARCSNYYMVE